METLLSLENLHVSFHTPQGDPEAVRGVSLELRAGETLGLVGESGCGKSLTALSLLGLLPPGATQTQDRLRFLDREWDRPTPEDWRSLRGREISIVFQEPFTSLNPVMRVGEQVAEVFRLHQGMARQAAWAASVEMLKKVGIPEAASRARQYPHQFSGGMRQRTLIAIALAFKPRLLIADEPTTALDVTVQAQILKLLKRLKREMGLTLMLISHDLGLVAQMADRLAVMYAGEIVEMGDLQAVLGDPKHPYTRGLLACLPRLGAQGRLASLEGQVPEISYLPYGCAFHPRCAHAFKLCRRRDPELKEVEGRRVACHLYGSGE